MKFFSQLGQDRYLLENFFRGKRGGVFVDIGAYDGETFSNTLFFERSMGWSGLCVEPLPSAFTKLKNLRKAICERVCVADFEGEAEFVESDSGIDEKMLSGLADKFDTRHLARLDRVATRRAQYRVPVMRLSTLLTKYALFDIDYCSIDTEGAELSILSDVDFERFRISVLTIENNYDDDRIPALMEAKGYVFHGKLEQDYVFRRRDVKPLPRVTVITAIEGDAAEREALLRGHMETLTRQTKPVEPTYVFAAGDPIPHWLSGRAVRCGAQLTRYQAWNIGLSLVTTPLVMTLGIRDRLAPDAVELIERTLWERDAAAVSADWRHCATQVEADVVESCYPSGSLLDAQKRKPQVLLWRMDVHLRAPRYPWRLRDGTVLEEGAEDAWHALLEQHLRVKIVHAPFVVGNTCGARDAGVEDRALLNDPGVSIL